MKKKIVFKNVTMKDYDGVVYPEKVVKVQEGVDGMGNTWYVDTYEEMPAWDELEGERVNIIVEILE